MNPTQTTPVLITGEELLAMGDIGPCELIDGRIVPISPASGKHGVLECRLSAAIDLFMQQHRLGWVMIGEVGIYTRRNPDCVRGADVVFLSRERWPDGPPQGFLEVAPDLVIEIMSPSDRWQDVRQKLTEYFAIGVHRVWIVEPENRTVLVFRSTTDLHQFATKNHVQGEAVWRAF